jgi:uncharacterized membrane protein/protein-disulfide isomerase
MGIAYRPAILRLLALLALAVSAALLIDGWSPRSRLCSFGSDCDQVVHSWLAERLVVPLPLVGVVYFAGLFTLSLVGSERARKLFRPLALLAGAGGVALIAAQLFAIGHVCPLCLVVDTAAMLLGGLALSVRGDPFPAVAPRQRGAWVLTAAAGLLGGIVLATVDGRAGSTTAAPAPEQVKAHWVEGKVNVVEVYDYDCRLCRNMHVVLRQFLAAQGEEVHYVGLPIAMPKHPQARHAVRAYFCAEKQGKGAAMADRLTATPFFTPQVCEEIADMMSLSMKAYRTCVADRALDERIDADLAWVKEACPNGLPVIWIQDERLEGLQKQPALQVALQRARQRMEAGSSD